jgi:hypothetical protein
MLEIGLVGIEERVGKWRRYEQENLSIRRCVDDGLARGLWSRSYAIP